jgi:hypothetical protein
MRCSDCQDAILDSVGQWYASAVQHHLSGCAECRQFDNIQRNLHERFTGSPAYSSSRLRLALKERLARERNFAWPDFLPDVAHLAGCALATAGSLFVLPWSASSIVTVGAALTVITYLLQSALRDAMQDEENFRDVDEIRT